MAENRVQMPSGMGGLVSYSSSSKSKLTIKPEVVIALVLLVIIAEIILQVI